MEEAAKSGATAIDRQIELINQEMNQTNFDQARGLLDQLESQHPEAGGRLFNRFARIKLDVFQEVKRPIDADLDDLELIQGNFTNTGFWPRHWYIQSWFMAPLLNSHQVDAFYLFYLCSELQVVSHRQDCLIRAMQYAVNYGEHGFFTYLDQNYPYDDTWLASTFHRSMMDALRAGYNRDGSRLVKIIGEMENAAGTPLQTYEIKQLRKHFSHLIAS